MAYSVEAKCENCGITAKGKDDLEKVFGWRKMASGKTIPQAWCRKCRSKKRVS